jgi:hypothetical protein
MGSRLQGRLGGTLHPLSCPHLSSFTLLWNTTRAEAIWIAILGLLGSFKLCAHNNKKMLCWLIEWQCVALAQGVWNGSYKILWFAGGKLETGSVPGSDADTACPVPSLSTPWSPRNQAKLAATHTAHGRLSSASALSHVRADGSLSWQLTPSQHNNTGRARCVAGGGRGAHFPTLDARLPHRLRFRRYLWYQCHAWSFTVSGCSTFYG